jgi:hypothetical protein
MLGSQTFFDEKTTIFYQQGIITIYCDDDDDARAYPKTGYAP